MTLPVTLVCGVKHLYEVLMYLRTGFVGVLDFLESPWIFKFIFKARKLFEFSCFCYNVPESPWKREKHRMFFKLILLNYVKLLNFRHWWCSDYCRQLRNTKYCAFRYWCKFYSLGGVTVSFFIWYHYYSLRGAAFDQECTWAVMLARGWSFPVAKMSSNATANYECVFNSLWMLTLTTLNTIWPNGPLPLNSFIDPDTFGKSCISFKPLNLEQNMQ